MRKVRHRQPAYSKILLSVRRAPENARGPHCLQQLQHGQQRLCKVLQALRQQAVSRLHRQNLPKVQSHGKRRRLHLRKVRFRVCSHASRGAEHTAASAKRGRFRRKPQAQQKRTEKTAGGAAADLLRSSRSARLRTAAADGISARGGSLDSRLGKEVRSKSEDLGCNHHDFVARISVRFRRVSRNHAPKSAWRRNARILFRGRRKFQYGGTAVVELCGQFQFSQKLFRRRVDARHTCGAVCDFGRCNVFVRSNQTLHGQRLQKSEQMVSFRFRAGRCRRGADCVNRQNRHGTFQHG